MATLADRLRALDCLPTIPDSLFRLSVVLLTETPDYDEIEEVVRFDEGLSALVLRRARSAHFGSLNSPQTLKETIARLGLQELRRVVLSTHSATLFHDRGEAYGLNRTQLWQGAVAGAAAAEIIARRTGHEQPGVCFLGGLLRDIGKLALDLMMQPGQIKAAFGQCPPSTSHIEWERRVLQTDHMEVGAELALQWGLPHDIVEAIGVHHGPNTRDDPVEADELRGVSAIVHGGDCIAAWMGYGVGVDGLRYAQHASAELGSAQMQSILPEAADTITRIIAFGSEVA